MASAACQLSATYASSLPTSETATIIDTADYDPLSFWAGGDPTKITFPVAGWYMLHGSVGGDTNLKYWARFLFNGTDYASEQMGQAVRTTSGFNISTECLGLGFFEAGEYAELLWYSSDSSKSSTNQISVTRLPSPIFFGESADGSAGRNAGTGELKWSPLPGCNNNPRTWWDAGTPEQVTVDETGYYLLAVQTCSTIATDLAIRLNGSTDKAYGYNVINNLSGANGGPVVIGALTATAGDYFSVHTSGDVYPAQFVVCRLSDTQHMVQAKQTTGTTAHDPTPVAFNSELFDSDAYHDNTTNNSRITVPSGQDGEYLVYAGMLVQGTTMSRLLKNGTAVSITERQGSPDIGANNNHYTHGSLTWVESLSSGDYFEMSWSGGSFTTDVTGTILGMIKIDDFGESIGPPFEDPCGAFLPQIIRRL